MEYIDKTFKRSVNYEKLCEEKLIFFKKGHVGFLFFYNIRIAGKQKNLLVKKTTVSRKICNEAVMFKKINILMDLQKIPDLFSKVYLIYKCKKSDFSRYGFDRDATAYDPSIKAEISLQKINRHKLYKYLDSYIFISDKYGDFIWSVIDSKDIKKVKSIVMLLLIALWHMNHNGDMYHDDIVVGKPGELVINNVLLEKTSKKNMLLFLSDKKKKFNIKLYGNQIRIIDFGKACNKDVYIYEKIRLDMNTSINQFYGRNHFFKNFKFKSEILFTIKCLFTYWNFAEEVDIDDILFKYYSKMARKHKKFDKFDEEIVTDFDKNFIKIICMFSNKWPNPPYYKK